MHQIGYEPLESRLRQREYDVSKLFRTKEQSLGLDCLDNLVPQNRQRQLLFAGYRVHRNLESLQHVVGSFPAQLYGHL
jgi:hypothetical protein